MNLKQYSTIIEKTAVFPRKVENFGIAYCLLGLFDELFEVEEKIINKDTKENILSEVGDVCWYVCALCNEIGISFEDIINNRKSSGSQYSPLKLFGLVKKHYRDNKEIDKDFFYKSLSGFISYLFDFSGVTDEEISILLENNYKKLIARRETNTLHGDGDNREKI